MIVFDTETTGLPGSSSTPLDKQPYITEFAGIKLNDETLEEVGRLEFLCKVPNPLTAEITKITGITNEMLVDAKPFSAHYKDLANFFLGERYMCAHNVGFDRGMLVYDLSRIGCQYKFPWPMNHICTVEKTMFIEGKRMNLGNVYKHAFGEEPKITHRAMPDVETLVRVVRWLREQRQNA